jgi:hypothetical protein
MSFSSLTLHAQSNSPRDFLNWNGLWSDHGGQSFRRYGWRMGHIAAEHLTKRRSIIGENLCILRPARDGDIGHATVERVFRTKFRVPVFDLESDSWRNQYRFFVAPAFPVYTHSIVSRSISIIEAIVNR